MVARNSWIAGGGGEAVSRQQPVCMRTRKQNITTCVISHRSTSIQLTRKQWDITYQQQDLNHMYTHLFPTAVHP